MGNINNDVQIGNLSSYGRLQVDKFNFPKTQKILLNMFYKVQTIN